MIGERNPEISNEKMEIFWDARRSTIPAEGYLGVGFLQNLEYLANHPHRYAIIVDILEGVLKAIQDIFYRIKSTPSQKSFLAWWSKQDAPFFKEYLRKAQGVPSKSWLLDEERYAALREMVVRGNIDLIHGDISTSETHRLIQKNAERRGQPITTIYLSNVFRVGGGLHGQHFNYPSARGLFDLPCLSADAICYMTSEWMPKGWREEFYHYTIWDLKALRGILEMNGTLEEFLAHHFALVLAAKDGGISCFTKGIPHVEPSNIGLSLDDVEERMRDDPNWLAWQILKNYFFLKKRK